jgi:hypothetical protein
MLAWVGPFEDPARIIGKSGIYMVLAGHKDVDGKGDTSTYKVVDIGQSAEATTRMASHAREACWKRNAPAGNILLFKFAPMPSVLYDETDRRIVECCLRAYHRVLPCGTECDQGYVRDDAVVITSSNRYAPLRETYSHGPR